MKNFDTDWIQPTLVPILLIILPTSKLTTKPTRSQRYLIYTHKNTNTYACSAKNKLHVSKNMCNL